MPIAIGLDVGTTTITAVAVNRDELVQTATVKNNAETTSRNDKSKGRSEWDVERILDRSYLCLRQLAKNLAQKKRQEEIIAIGITGQQHGVVVVDEALDPLTPLINWQDQRGEDLIEGASETYTQRADRLAGPTARQVNGCRLATGYMGTTLLWLKENKQLPTGRPCFVMDYVAAKLAGSQLVTDPTCAASSGMLNVQARNWNDETIAALGLDRETFAEIQEAGFQQGSLVDAASKATNLPAGLPIFVPIGDSQASFVGTVAHRREASVLVNVGTGGQVVGFTNEFVVDDELEIRPHPGEGNLLVYAGLCGGRSYALLESFFRNILAQFGDTAPNGSLFEKMNELAKEIPAGADGLRCTPLFTGTRAQPELRANWSGMSAQNFTPAHMCRALLEGMASVFRDGAKRIEQATNQPIQGVFGSGNGLRENPVLRQCIVEEFELQLSVPDEKEEAARGAARIALDAATR